VCSYKDQIKTFYSVCLALEAEVKVCRGLTPEKEVEHYSMFQPRRIAGLILKNLGATTRVSSVELALQSQHEMFSDSRIQLRSGPYDWESKSRRRLRSLVPFTMDNGNLDEHGETKVM